MGCIAFTDDACDLYAEHLGKLADKGYIVRVTREDSHDGPIGYVVPDGEYELVRVSRLEDQEGDQSGFWHAVMHPWREGENSPDSKTFLYADIFEHRFTVL